MLKVIEINPIEVIEREFDGDEFYTVYETGDPLPKPEPVIERFTLPKEFSTRPCTVSPNRGGPY